jgi:hypothetical protein
MKNKIVSLNSTPPTPETKKTWHGALAPQQRANIIHSLFCCINTCQTDAGYPVYFNAYGLFHLLLYTFPDLFTDLRLNGSTVYSLKGMSDLDTQALLPETFPHFECRGLVERVFQNFGFGTPILHNTPLTNDKGELWGVLINIGGFDLTFAIKPEIARTSVCYLDGQYVSIKDDILPGGPIIFSARLLIPAPPLLPAHCFTKAAYTFGSAEEIRFCLATPTRPGHFATKNPEELMLPISPFIRFSTKFSLGSSFQPAVPYVFLLSFASQYLGSEPFTRLIDNILHHYPEQTYTGSLNQNHLELRLSTVTNISKLLNFFPCLRPERMEILNSILSGFILQTFQTLLRSIIFDRFIYTSGQEQPAEVVLEKALRVIKKPPKRVKLPNHHLSKCSSHMRKYCSGLPRTPQNKAYLSQSLEIIRAITILKATDILKYVENDFEQQLHEQGLVPAIAYIVESNPSIFTKSTFLLQDLYRPTPQKITGFMNALTEAMTTSRLSLPRHQIIAHSVHSFKLYLDIERSATSDPVQNQQLLSALVKAESELPSDNIQALQESLSATISYWQNLISKADEASLVSIQAECTNCFTHIAQCFAAIEKSLAIQAPLVWLERLPEIANLVNPVQKRFLLQATAQITLPASPALLRTTPMLIQLLRLENLGPSLALNLFLSFGETQSPEEFNSSLITIVHILSESDSPDINQAEVRTLVKTRLFTPCLALLNLQPCPGLSLLAKFFTLFDTPELETSWPIFHRHHLAHLDLETTATVIRQYFLHQLTAPLPTPESPPPLVECLQFFEILEPRLQTKVSSSLFPACLRVLDQNPCPELALLTNFLTRHDTPKLKISWPIFHRHHLAHLDHETAATVIRQYFKHQLSDLHPIQFISPGAPTSPPPLVECLQFFEALEPELQELLAPSLFPVCLRVLDSNPCPELEILTKFFSAHDNPDLEISWPIFHRHHLARLDLETTATVIRQYFKHQLADLHPIQFISPRTPTSPPPLVECLQIFEALEPELQTLVSPSLFPVCLGVLDETPCPDLALLTIFFIAHDTPDLERSGPIFYRNHLADLPQETAITVFRQFINHTLSAVPEALSPESPSPVSICIEAFNSFAPGLQTYLLPALFTTCQELLNQVPCPDLALLTKFFTTHDTPDFERSGPIFYRHHLAALPQATAEIVFRQFINHTLSAAPEDLSPESPSPVSICIETFNSFAPELQAYLLPALFTPCLEALNQATCPDLAKLITFFTDHDTPDLKRSWPIFHRHHLANLPQATAATVFIQLVRTTFSAAPEAISPATPSPASRCIETFDSLKPDLQTYLLPALFSPCLEVLNQVPCPDLALLTRFFTGHDTPDLERSWPIFRRHHLADLPQTTATTVLTQFFRNSLTPALDPTTDPPGTTPGFSECIRTFNSQTPELQAELLPILFPKCLRRLEQVPCPDIALLTTFMAKHDMPNFNTSWNIFYELHLESLTPEFRKIVLQQLFNQLERQLKTDTSSAVAARNSATHSVLAKSIHAYDTHLQKFAHLDPNPFSSPELEIQFAVELSKLETRTQIELASSLKSLSLFSLFMLTKSLFETATEAAPDSPNTLELQTTTLRLSESILTQNAQKPSLRNSDLLVCWETFQAHSPEWLNPITLLYIDRNLPLLTKWLSQNASTLTTFANAFEQNMHTQPLFALLQTGRVDIFPFAFRVFTVNKKDAATYDLATKLLQPYFLETLLPSVESGDLPTAATEVAVAAPKPKRGRGRKKAGKPKHAAALASTAPLKLSLVRRPTESELIFILKLINYNLESQPDNPNTIKLIQWLLTNFRIDDLAGSPDPIPELVNIIGHFILGKPDNPDLSFTYIPWALPILTSFEYYKLTQTYLISLDRQENPLDFITVNSTLTNFAVHHIRLIYAACTTFSTAPEEKDPSISAILLLAEFLCVFSKKLLAIFQAKLQESPSLAIEKQLKKSIKEVEKFACTTFPNLIISVLSKLFTINPENIPDFLHLICTKKYLDILSCAIQAIQKLGFDANVALMEKITARLRIDLKYLMEKMILTINTHNLCLFMSFMRNLPSSALDLSQNLKALAVSISFDVITERMAQLTESPETMTQARLLTTLFPSIVSTDHLYTLNAYPPPIQHRYIRAHTQHLCLGRKLSREASIIPGSGVPPQNSNMLRDLIAQLLALSKPVRTAYLREHILGQCLAAQTYGFIENKELVLTLLQIKNLLHLYPEIFNEDIVEAIEMLLNTTLSTHRTAFHVTYPNGDTMHKEENSTHVVIHKISRSSADPERPVVTRTTGFSTHDSVQAIFELLLMQRHSNIKQMERVFLTFFENINRGMYENTLHDFLARMITKHFNMDLVFISCSEQAINSILNLIYFISLAIQNQLIAESEVSKLINRLISCCLFVRPIQSIVLYTILDFLDLFHAHYPDQLAILAIKTLKDSLPTDSTNAGEIAAIEEAKRLINEMAPKLEAEVLVARIIVDKADPALPVPE